MTAENATINGEPGVIARLNDKIDFVAAVEVEDGLMRTVRLILNPDKLRQVTSSPRML